MTPHIIQQGAEAKIILSNNFIIKDRTKKSYRIPEIDEKIRARRTRSEAKLLLKASNIINSPKPFFQPSIKNSTKLKMPFIDGKKLSEHLDNFSLNKQKQICRQIGESIAKLHNQDIIHGDLTTSNMILVEKDTSASQKIDKITNNKKTKNNLKLINKGGGGVDGGLQKDFKIFFIDFGLGFISHKFEDKAVDIHLLRQALEAKHFKNWQALVEEVFKGYKKYSDSKIVFERLKAVEKRGRYKG